MDAFTSKVALGSSNDKERKIACVNCDNETYHRVLQSVNIVETNEMVTFVCNYEIVSCQGCKGTSFRKSWFFSEDMDYDETGEPVYNETVKLYPSRIAGRKPLKNTHLLPKEVLEIYEETHAASLARFNILTGIGIRALVEIICKKEGAKGKVLTKKIDDLVTKGILSQSQVKAIHKTRILGNKSAHKVTAASDESIDIAIDIVESLILNVYIIPHKAEKLSDQ